MYTIVEGSDATVSEEYSSALAGLKVAAESVQLWKQGNTNGEQRAIYAIP